MSVQRSRDATCVGRPSGSRPTPTVAGDLTISVFEAKDQDAVIDAWLDGFGDTVWQYVYKLWRDQQSVAFAGVWAAWTAATCVFVPKLRSSKAVVVSAVATAGLWAVSLPLMHGLGVRSLRKKVLKSGKGENDMMDIMANWVQHPHRCFWTAKIGDVLAGAVAVGIGPEGMEHPEAAAKVYDGAITAEDAFVYRMFTTRPARRRGVASKALAVAEDYARSHGCRRTLLGTGNADAKVFYERNGYSVIKEVPYGKSAKMYVMEKPLKGA